MPPPRPSPAAPPPYLLLLLDGTVMVILEAFSVQSVHLVKETVLA
jgi:hypothetical protein